MNPLDTNSQLTRDYVERLRSLFEDGYHAITATRTTDGYFAKLRHHRNGRIITLTASFKSSQLLQKTNGRVTHSQQYL